MNQERLKERIEMLVVEEIQSASLIKEPENYIPTFVLNLTDRIYELVLDEVAFKK